MLATFLQSPNLTTADPTGSTSHSPLIGDPDKNRLIQSLYCQSAKAIAIFGFHALKVAEKSESVLGAIHSKREFYLCQVSWLISV